MAVTAPLDHDEHQFMASAYLVATRGLQPYQDFPYFHMPNLVYLYGWLLPLSPYPLLLLRLFVGLCAIGIAVLVFTLTHSALAAQVATTRLLVAGSCTLLLVNSPLLLAATAHVWNHTPATFCALLAFLCHWRALRRDHWFPLLASGFCLGMAIGIRLSFAPLAAAFVIALLYFPSAAGVSKTRRLLLFAAGCTLANLPALYFLFTQFDRFWFGNIGYAAVNTRYRQATAFGGAMTLADKLIYLLKKIYVEPGDLLILVSVLFVIVSSRLHQWWSSSRVQVGLGLLLLALPFLYLGAFAPTPAWYQYFFAPMPFLLLMAPYLLAQAQEHEQQQAVTRLLLVAALLSVAFGPLAQSPHSLRQLTQPTTWFPLQFHNTAQEISQALTTGATPNEPTAPILTLAPLYAVESGFPIYPAFATGPFAWRVAPLLSTGERQRQGLIGPDELTTLLAQSAPAAILLTNEANIRASERPLRQAAQQHGFRPQPLSDGSTLWLKTNGLQTP